MISDADRQQLLGLARETILAHVTGGPVPKAAFTGPAARRAAVFVSLHEHGELRGCIGHLETDTAIGDAVAHCARMACSADPRFPSVVKAELQALEIEISILGPLETISSPEEIEIGRHGVLVEQGRHRGLLLPQVATEWQWSSTVFVEQTCRKAGLSYDAWKRGASLCRFEAEVFREK
jgi:AmmeMemoRadiSam system protein A